MAGLWQMEMIEECVHEHWLVSTTIDWSPSLILHLIDQDGFGRHGARRGHKERGRHAAVAAADRVAPDHERLPPGDGHRIGAWVKGQSVDETRVVQNIADTLDPNAIHCACAVDDA